MKPDFLKETDNKYACALCFFHFCFVRSFSVSVPWLGHPNLKFVLHFIERAFISIDFIWNNVNSIRRILQETFFICIIHSNPEKDRFILNIVLFKVSSSQTLSRDDIITANFLQILCFLIESHKYVFHFFSIQDKMLNQLISNGQAFAAICNLFAGGDYIGHPKKAHLLPLPIFKVPFERTDMESWARKAECMCISTFLSCPTLLLESPLSAL